MSNNKKRNIIIGVLCAIVLLMAVGYAAFNTVLNIKGTSNITSSWNIKITKIETKNIVGTASNNGDPSFEELSATFKTSLQAPGDSIEYDITVSNAGSLDAKLDEITLSDTNNPAIKFTASGMTKGDVITAGSTKILTVKVEYLSTVASQPASTTSNLTVSLDYSQSESGSVGTVITPEDLKSLTVSSGNGLYVDKYEEGRYVYKGANPNNYITFNREPWRIISLENDGTLKIIKDESIGKLALDSENSNDWAHPTTLNTYLNNDYYTNLSDVFRNQIQSHNFGIGPVVGANSDLSGQIVNENKVVWNGNIGLISVSDYFRANTNMEQCGNYELNNINKEICKKTNYLVSSGYYWTISPFAAYPGLFCYIDSTGAINRNYASLVDGEVRPSLYLKSDIQLSGDGTVSNPYVIE